MEKYPYSKTSQAHERNVRQEVYKVLPNLERMMEMAHNMLHLGDIPYMW